MGSQAVEPVPGSPPGRYARKIPLTESELRTLAPPPRYEPPRRRSRAWLVLVLLVVIGVVTGYFAYMYLFAVDVSPEEAFRGFVDAMNTGDMRAAVDFTVDKFASEAAKEAEIDEMEAMLAEEGGYTILIHSVDVIYRKDMAPSVKESLDELERQVESLYGVNVKDSCGLEFTTTTSHAGDVNTGEGSIPLVKIGASWYIATIYEI